MSSKILDITQFVVGGKKKKRKERGGDEYNKSATSNVSIDKVFSGLELTKSECLDPNATVCSSQAMIETITSFIEIDDKIEPEKIIQMAKEKTNCDTESCVIKKLTGNLLTRDIANKELELRFKSKGPKYDDNAWLSNFDIDGVLLRWMREFDSFMACPFAMRDFDKTHEAFSTIYLPDVYRGKYTIDLGAAGKVTRKNDKFGCILNTDVSTGPGKHWVAAFVDMAIGNDTANIYYFNSAGNKPFREMIIWQERTKKDLETIFSSVNIIDIVKVDHQKEDVACGLYSLYFIRRMLEGTQYTFFTDPKNPIPDAAMNEFRRYIFI